VISSELLPEIASELGLEPGTPVVGGGGDQAAGAVGNGIVSQGLVSSTIGTSGVVFAHSDEIVLDPHGRVHTFCHAVPGAWHVMGVTQGAGLSLRWFRDQFGAAEVDMAGRLGVDPYELLTREAERSVPGSDGLIWLPYLMGERTPHLDATARGVLFGLTARHTRGDVVRAILEGVTYSLRDCLSILREMGVPAAQVRASGGGARSVLWRQMQADVFGTDVVTIAVLAHPKDAAKATARRDELTAWTEAELTTRGRQDDADLFRLLQHARPGRGIDFRSVPREVDGIRAVDALQWAAVR